MRYLAINTAAPTIEIAVIYDEMEEYRKLEKVMAAEQLLPEVDAALDKMGIALSDLDYFVCVVGPGSFTGIRIGVNTVRAFAYALNKNAYGVTYNRLMAYNISGGSVTFTDGGGDTCYAAVYNGDETIAEPICIYKKDAESFKKEYDYNAAISDFELPCCELYSPNIVNMKKAAEYAIKNRLGTQPVYIRKPQPDRKGSDI